MSDELTRLLTETLRSRETDIGPMPELASRVLQKGRSAHNRRLALGWGAAGGVVVVALAAALLGPVGQRVPNPGPANSRMPSPTVTSTATSPSTPAVTADEYPLVTYASKLPVGRPIALLPRAERRGTTVVVVTADHVVTLPPRTGFAFDLTPSAAGLLVAAHSDAFTGGGPDPEQALYVIASDGNLTRLHQGAFNGLAVDPSGKEYALAEVGLGAYDKVHITVASLSQSGTKHSRTEPIGTMVLGWTTHGVLMSDTRQVWLWEPGASSQTELPGVVDASAMPTDPGRLLVAAGQTGPSYCLHLFTVRGGQLGPVLTCGTGNGWTVSPDGRRAAFGSTVVDLVNGRVGPDLMDKLGITFGHWEDSTRVLTHVLGNDPRGSTISIWVRCDVNTAACEQAPIKGSDGSWTLSDW